MDLLVKSTRAMKKIATHTNLNIVLIILSVITICSLLLLWDYKDNSIINKIFDYDIYLWAFIGDVVLYTFISSVLISLVLSIISVWKKVNVIGCLVLLIMISIILFCGFVTVVLSAMAH